MASHLSSIGFSVATEEEFAQLANQVAPLAEEVRVPGGRYLRWTGQAGEELWLQVNGRQLTGMNPHFAGRSSLPVRVTHRLERPGDSALDGALHAWAQPGGETTKEGAYPFVFDLPDAARYADLALPGIAEAQVTGFAHEAQFFPSEAAFDADQEGSQAPFASRSFVPLGLFNAAGDDGQVPAALAFFTGHVVEARQLRNSLTDNAFHWALIDTYGGRFDVVIDPALLPDPPVPGGVLKGTYWLSGRLLSFPRKQRSFWKRLFGPART